MRAPHPDNLQPTLQRLQELLGVDHIPLDTPIAEIVCWLKAKRDDIEAKAAQEERDNGNMPLVDAELFVYVTRGLKRDANMCQVMEALRLKKRLGYKQQLALELWDAYYKTGKIQIRLTDDEASEHTPGVAEHR